MTNRHSQLNFLKAKLLIFHPNLQLLSLPYQQIPPTYIQFLPSTSPHFISTSLKPLCSTVHSLHHVYRCSSKLVLPRLPQSLASWSLLLFFPLTGYSPQSSQRERSYIYTHVHILGWAPSNISPIVNHHTYGKSLTPDSVICFFQSLRTPFISFLLASAPTTSALSLFLSNVKFVPPLGILHWLSLCLTCCPHDLQMSASLLLI